MDYGPKKFKTHIKCLDFNVTVKLYDLRFDSKYL